MPRLVSTKVEGFDSAVVPGSHPTSGRWPLWRVFGAFSEIYGRAFAGLLAGRALLAAALIMCACPNANSAPAANWTILIYMNAKNDLESFALANFKDIAATGGSENVHLVVQLGRLRGPARSWTGVRRFLVTQGLEVDDVPLVDLGDSGPLTDLGGEVALEDFVKWGIEEFPVT